MHLSSFLAVTFLALQTAALPRRYSSNTLFSALFTSFDQRDVHVSPAFLQRPFAAAVINAVSGPHPQQLALSTDPQPPVPSSPQSSSSGNDLSVEYYPRPTPLATAQPYPLNEEPNYGRVCNLGNRVDPRQEDAAELAYAACQGGMVRRLSRVKAEGESEAVGASGAMRADEVLECVACEVGSWNAMKGEINR